MSSPHNENQLLSLAPLWCHDEATRVLASNGRFSFGQSSSCDVQVDQPGVQRHHCTIVCRHGVATITPINGADLSVNAIPVTGSSPVSSGDTIQLGAASFRAHFRPASSFLRHAVPSQHSELTASLTAQATSDGERRALDKQHSELMQWQHRLDDRCVEMEQQAAQITSRYTELLTQQREFEQRSNRFESARQEAFDLLKLQQDMAAKNAEWEKELNEQKHALANRNADLDQREAAVEVLEQLRHQLESDRTQLDDEFNELEQKRADASDRFSILQQIAEDISNLESEWKKKQRDAQSELDQLAQQIEAEELSLKNRIAESERAADEANTIRQDAERSRVEMVAWREEQESELKRAQEEFAARESQFEEMLREFSESQATADEQRSFLSVGQVHLHAGLESLSEREHSLQTDHHQSNRLHCELNDRLADLDKREEQIRTWQDEIQGQRDQFELYSAEQRADLEAHAEQLNVREEEIRAQTDELHTQQADLRRRLDELQSDETDRATLEAQRIELEESRQQVKTAARKLATREESVSKWAGDLEAEKMTIQLQRTRHAEEVEAWQSRMSYEQDNLATRTSTLAAAEQRLQTEIDELESVQEQAAAAIDEKELARQAANLAQREDELQQQAETLEAREHELESRADEIASLLTDARRHMRNRADQVDVPESQSQAGPTASSEVQQLQEQLAEVVVERNELSIALTEGRHAFETVRYEMDTRPEVAGASVTEEELLQEVEQLRTEISSIPESRASGEFAAQVEQYESTIRYLQSQLQASEQQTPEDGRTEFDAEYLAMIEELTAAVEERDQQIKALSEQSQGTTFTDIDEAELQTMHRELDTRAIVLDERESELWNRQRLLEQSEAEIEAQRHNIIGARQQLELAQVELQVAMDHAKTTQESGDPETGALLGMADGVAPSVTIENDIPEVRSKIGEQFGINNSDGSEAIPQDSTSLTAVDVYSRESSDAVSMSLSEVHRILIEHQADVTGGEANDGDGDDFGDWDMEHLLVQNRENAGNSLPEELSDLPVAKSAPKPGPTQASQPVSFLGTGISGEHNPDNDPAQSASKFPPKTVSESKFKGPQNRTLDLNELCDKVDSFRQLSPRSIENGRVTYALKQEHGELTARKLILAKLILTAMTVAAGAIMNLIPFLVVYLVSGLAGLSAIELMVKWFSVHRRVRNVAVVPCSAVRDHSHSQVSVPTERRPADRISEGESAAELTANAQEEEQLSHPEANHLSGLDTKLGPPETDTLTDEPTLDPNTVNDFPKGE